MSMNVNKVGLCGPGKYLQLLMGFMMLSVMLVPMQTASAAERYMLEFGVGEKTSELRLSIGKSQIINSRQPIDQVVIGSPDIADIKLLTSRQILILGKKPGHTNLVFRDKQRALIAVIDVVVGYDRDGIKRKIFEAMPDERQIEVHGENDAVMLKGEVSSLLNMNTALSIASSFVPKDKVINMLEVGGGQQVMLKVKISEVERRSLRELGVQMQIEDSGLSHTWSIYTGDPTTVTNRLLSGSYIDSPTSDFDLLGFQIQALENKGLAKVLAEPNLTALSGQEASFLAGGEIPVPVAQTAAGIGVGVAPAITVEYKEFGVGLKFTPTVLSNKKINLKLNAEVSEIDRALSSSTGVGTAFGISTRRAGTTIEVADGQSFAIAGLMTSNMNNDKDQVPGLGDIPILGTLFSSTSFSRDESELVIAVTPKLVKPVTEDKIKLPSDNVVPPTWVDQYLMGRLEGTQEKKEKSQEKAGSAGTAEEQKTAATSEGLEGSFGHKN